MLIDWFTVGAQVVNFLVLVVVLKLVLFDRVVAAMDHREEAIAARIRAAEEAETTAGDEADAFRARRRELEEEREQRLRDAESAAATRRRELLDQARSEVDELRAGWEEALRRDRAHFVEEVRRRTAEQVCTISRRALAELADADLESQLVRVAIRRLEADADQLVPLVEESHAAGTPVLVQSGFALSDELAGEVVEAVTTHLRCDVADIEVAVDPELLCGLQITVGGWAAGWSLGGYVDAVAEELDAVLPVDGDGAGSTDAAGGPA